MASRVIYGILSANATVAGFVGTKIYPVRTPQAKALPYIVFNQLSIDPSDNKSLVSKLDTVYFNVAVFANDYDTGTANILTISAAVRTALDRVSGTYSTVNCQSIRYEDEADGYDEGAKCYIREMRFKLRIIK